MMSRELLLRVVDEEIARIEARLDLLIERLRASQRGRGVAEGELITRARVDDITRQVFGERD
jgi:hypothetical protein